ncbi:MAG: cell division ATP-binding protein FtsE [Helicobacteraceae bacterium]
MIKAQNLTIAYEKEVILKDVSFYVAEGDLVFITGKSGTGKSSLFKTLYGELQIAGGILTVGGLDLGMARKSAVRDLRRKLGIVFQDYKLIEEWDVSKNIALPLVISNYSQRIINEQVKTLLGHIKLSHKAHRYPRELSGGEQQRVGVARALAHGPSLILADEPTGNLDEYSAEMVINLFKSINELNKTVLIVTHKMPTNLGVKFRHFHIEDKGLHEIV